MKASAKVVPLRRPRSEAVATQPDTSKLARQLAAHAPHDGTFDLRVPGVTATLFAN